MVDELFLVMRQGQRAFDVINPRYYVGVNNPLINLLRPDARVIIEKEWDGEIRFIGHCVIDSIGPEQQDPYQTTRSARIIKLKQFQPFIPPRFKTQMIRNMLKALPYYYSSDSIRIIPREIFESIIRACSSFSTDFMQEFEKVPNEYDLLDNILNREESDTLEFKATMRCPIDAAKIKHLGPESQISIQDTNKGSKPITRELIEALELAIVKTVAAYLNTNGGTLIVGVYEDKQGKRELVGIEHDFETFHNKKNWDEWRSHFLSLLINMGISEAVTTNNVHLRPDSKNGKKLARITVTPSKKETWIRSKNKSGNSEQYFFVRNTGQTNALTGPALLDYVRNRFES